MLNNELSVVKKKIKIIFYIHSFINFGGAERILTILLQHLDRSKFEICLLMAKKEGRYLSEIPDDVKVINLDVARTVLAIPKIALVLGQIKPDIFFCIRSLVLGFSTKIFKYFSFHTKFIVREVIIPSEHNKTESFPVFYNVGYRILYPWFDKIICQSDYMINDLRNRYKINDRKLIKIHNPVDTKRIEDHLKSNFVKHDDRSQIRLLAIGRLMYEKGFDLLIDAFVLLDKRFYLTILGEGVQKDSLEEKISSLNLESRIDLVGFVENPYEYMSKSDIFVLPSRYEGLPNIVLEVMLCGIPVVAFKCPGGIDEIVIPGDNGFFVPNGDVKALAEFIMLASKTRFDNNKIKNFVKSKFDYKNRVRDYENLFSNMALNI